ncbi:MAG: hypothetical protein LBT95_02475 [Treponema sp.]|nr:hypothetical protein [Treponema sp.]
MQLSTSPFKTAKGLSDFSDDLDAAIHNLCTSKYGIVLNQKNYCTADRLEAWPNNEFVYGRYKTVTKGCTQDTDFWVGLEFTSQDVFIIMWFSQTGAGHSQPLTLTQLNSLNSYHGGTYADLPIANGQKTDIWLRMEAANMVQFGSGAKTILENFIDEVLSRI